MKTQDNSVSSALPRTAITVGSSSRSYRFQFHNSCGEGATGSSSMLMEGLGMLAMLIARPGLIRSKSSKQGVVEKTLNCATSVCEVMTLVHQLLIAARHVQHADDRRPIGPLGLPIGLAEPHQCPFDGVVPLAEKREIHQGQCPSARHGRCMRCGDFSAPLLPRHVDRHTDGCEAAEGLEPRCLSRRVQRAPANPLACHAVTPLRLGS